MNSLTAIPIVAVWPRYRTPRIPSPRLLFWLVPVRSSESGLLKPS